MRLTLTKQELLDMVDSPEEVCRIAGLDPTKWHMVPESYQLTVPIHLEPLGSNLYRVQVLG